MYIFMTFPHLSLYVITCMCLYVHVIFCLLCTTAAHEMFSCLSVPQKRHQPIKALSQKSNSYWLIFLVQYFINISFILYLIQMPAQKDTQRWPPEVMLGRCCSTETKHWQKTEYIVNWKVETQKLKKKNIFIPNKFKYFSLVFHCFSTHKSQS